MLQDPNWDLSEDGRVSQHAQALRVTRSETAGGLARAVSGLWDAPLSGQTDPWPDEPKSTLLTRRDTARSDPAVQRPPRSRFECHRAE
jgi:hypothetical protein